MIRYAHDPYPSRCTVLDLCCTCLSFDRAVRDNTTVRPKELPGSASSHHSVSAFDRFKSVQNSTLGACDASAFRNSQVSAFPSGRAHQNTHKIEGTVISCPQFRGVRFSQVSARTGSTVHVVRLQYVLSV